MILYLKPIFFKFNLFSRSIFLNFRILPAKVFLPEGKINYLL